VTGVTAMADHLDEPFVHQFLRRLYAAVNAHDAAAVAALCAPDVAWHDPAALAPLRGRDAVYRFHHEGMFRALPDVGVTMIDGPYLSFDHTAVAVRVRIAGTMTGPLTPPGFAPTDQPVEFETAEFSRFEGGLLAHHVVVVDRLALAIQIGAVPGPGSLGERLGLWGQHLAALLARTRRAS